MAAHTFMLNNMKYLRYDNSASGGVYWMQKDVRVTQENDGTLKFHVAGTPYAGAPTEWYEWSFVKSKNVLYDTNIYFIDNELLSKFDGYIETITDTEKLPIKVATDDATKTVTVTLDDNVLGTTSNTRDDITVTSEDTANTYKLALATNVSEGNKATWSGEPTWKAPEEPSGQRDWTANIGELTAGWFVSSEKGDSITYTSGTAGGTFTLRSTDFASDLTAENINQRVTFKGNRVFIDTGVLGKADAQIVGSGIGSLTFFFTEAATPKTIDAHWEATKKEGEPAQTEDGSFTYLTKEKTEGYTVSGTDIKYVKEDPAEKPFTVSGFKGTKVIAPTAEVTETGQVQFAAKVDPTSTGYTVKLGKAVLEAATPEKNTAAPTQIKITSDEGEPAEGKTPYTVALALDTDATEALKTEKSAASNHDATLAKETEGDKYTHKYTSDSYQAYYLVGKEKTTDTTDNQISAYAPQDGLNFTITGLKSTVGATEADYTKAAELIQYTAAKAAEGEEGQAGYQEATPATFKIDANALDKKDVVITKTDEADSAKEILGEINVGENPPKDYSSATKEIELRASANTRDNSVTFTAAGWEAGYLTKQEASETVSETDATLKYGVTVNDNNHKDAQIIYAKQRHGESFTITGLKAETITAINTALSDKTNKEKILKGENGTITLTEGVKINTADNTLTLSKDVLDTTKEDALVVFKRADDDATHYESTTPADGDPTRAYAAGDIHFAEGVNTLQGEMDFSVGTDKLGDEYISKYKVAFEEEQKELFKSTANESLTKAAVFEPKKSTEDAGNDAATGAYNYTSSHSADYYVKLRDYSQEAAAFAAGGSADNYKGALEGYMANKGETVYKYIEEGYHLAKQRLTIDGVKAGLANTVFAEKRKDEDTKNASIVVDFTYKPAGAAEDAEPTPTVVIKEGALPDEGKRSGNIISISGDSASAFKLAFDGDLTSGNDEVMSDNVEFKAEEKPGESGTYVVTLAGKSAGYVQVTEANKDQFMEKYPNVKAGDYVYQDTQGAQQFTISGLASGLLDEKDSKGFKTALEALSTSATQKNIYFEMKDAYLAKAETYEAAGTIKITYNGTVDVKNTQVTAATKAATDETTVAFTIGEGFKTTGSLVTADEAKWAPVYAEDATDPKITEKFAYTTERTADGWTLGSSKGAEATKDDPKDQLTYTKAIGGDTLITLDGLIGSTAEEVTATQAALTADANFKPCTADGEKYYFVKENFFYDGQVHKDAIAWYLEAAVKKDEDGKVILDNDGYATKADGNTTEATIVYDSDGTTLLKGEKTTNFLVELPDTVFKRDSETKISYTEGAVTSSDKAPHYGDTIHIGFAGIETKDTAVANDTPASLTETGEKTGTYKYSAAHKDVYFLSADGTEEGVTTTYTYKPAVNDYGFTIKGLPAGLKDEGEGKTSLTGNNIEDYFKFTAPTQEAPNGTIVLKAAAFDVKKEENDAGAGDENDNAKYGTANKDFTLSDLKLDGDGDGKRDSFGEGENAKYVTIAFSTNDSEGTPLNIKTGVETEAELKEGAVEAGAKSATYTYTSEETKSYFTFGKATATIDGEPVELANQTVSYKAPTGGEALFTISGLAYKKETVEGVETVTKPLLTTYEKDQTTGYSTTTVAEQGDIDVVIGKDQSNVTTATVMLYKGALAGEPVAITDLKTEENENDDGIACTLNLFDTDACNDYLAAHTDLSEAQQAEWLAKVVPTKATEAVGTLGNTTGGVEGGAQTPTDEYIFEAGGYYTLGNDGKVSFTGGADAIEINGLGNFLGGATIQEGKVTATDSTDGNIVYKITGTKPGEDDKPTTVELLKITFTPAKEAAEGQAATKASYSVALGADFKTEGANDNAELTVTLTVADHSANKGATIAFDTASYTTSEANAAAKLKYNKLTDETESAAETYNHIYTTAGKTAGFTASGENNIKKLEWNKGETIDFTITGLAKDAAEAFKTNDKLIEYNFEKGKEAAGDDPATKDTYTFTFAESALKQDNVTIKNDKLTDAEIKGKVTFAENSQNNGTDEIKRDVDVNEGVLKYTEAGWHKGYLTKEQAATKVSEEDQTPKYGVTDTSGAQIVYAKQRGGDTFTISGLNEAVLTTIEAKKDKVVKADEQNPTTVNVTDGADTDATTYFTVDTTTGAVVLKEAAVGTADIIFTNTTKTDDLYEGSSYENTQTVTLEGITQVDMREFEAPGYSSGNYVEQYNAAYKTAYDKKYKEKKGDIEIPKNAKDEEGTVTYTSSYKNAFYTVLPKYSEDAVVFANNDDDDKTGAADLTMAGKKQTFFKFEKATDKYEFKLSGMKDAGVDGNAFVEKTEDTTPAELDNAKIIVDYTTEDKIPVVTIADKSVLAENPAANDTVAISDVKMNEANAEATLKFGTALTSGEGEIMSEDVKFNVVEVTEANQAQFEGKAVGSYVVTLKGNTAGYVEVTEANKAQFEGKAVGSYVQRAQKGAQQFTLTGLKSGLVEDTASGFKTALEELSTGETKNEISFEIKKEYLADVDTYKAEGKGTITIAYDGKVTNTPDHKGVTENKVEKDGDNTTVELTANVADLSRVTETKGGWSTGTVTGANDTTVNAILFKTGRTADGWTPGKTDNTLTKNDKLTYTASTGEDTIITLTGLISTDVNTFVTKYDTVDDNEFTKLGFVPADNEGKAYVRYEYKVVEGGKTVNKASYYAATEMENGKPSSNANAVDLATVENWLVNLKDSAFDISKMGENGAPVVMKTGDVTNNDQTYKNKTFGVLFGDNATTKTAAADRTETAATLTETGDKTGTYDYVAAHKAAIFNDTETGTKTHTYTYYPASGKYGFTIEGLPKNIDQTAQDFSIDKYFTFTKPADGKAVGTVKLKEEAFGNLAEYAEKATTDGVISLTKIDLDGTDATTGIDKVKVGDVDTPISIQLELPEESATFLTEKSIKTNGTLGNGTLADDGTYTYEYTSTAYNGYFTPAEDKRSVNFTGPEGGKKLFTITGLPRDRYADTHDVDGKITQTWGHIGVDEEKKVVTLYKDALTGKAVSVTGEGVKLKLFDETAYNALTDAEKALFTQNGKTAADYSVPTKGEDHTPAVDYQGDTLTFTAGYTEASYKLNSNETSVDVTEQYGAPDKIKVTGLREGIQGVEVEQDKNNKDLYTVSAGETALFKITYHEAAKEDLDTTKYVDERNPFYTVAIQPDAIDFTGAQETIEVSIEKAGVPGSTVKAIFNTEALEKDGKISEYVEDDALSADTGTGNRIFTTKGITKGYELESESDYTKLKWKAPTQKEFTITGLKTDALGKDDVLLTQADGKYTFEIKPNALNKEDVFISSNEIQSANITATISDDLAATEDGKTAITANIKADNKKVVKYQADGFQPGYLTAEDASSKNYGDVTVPTNAKIVYAKQRGGDTFTIEGLNDDAINSINALEKGAIPASGTIAEGVKLVDLTLTVSDAALDEKNIVFKNTTDKSTLENEEAVKKYNLVLDTTAQLKAPTVTASGIGEKYVEAYQKSFDEEVTKAAEENDDITKDASLKEHKDADAADANAKSKVYDYVSSHTEAYFTALPSYEKSIEAYANAGGANKFSDLKDIYVAGDSNTTVYKYKEAGKKTEFSIEGLATTTTNVEGNIEEIADANDAATKAIVVNTKNFTVTINNAKVLPAVGSTTANDIVKLSGKGVGDYKLAFGETLKTGAHDVMSEPIPYSVEETKDADGKGTGNYTVTLSGQTAGYKEVNGTFVPQEQKGGQRFTITGLAPNLTKTQITENLFEEKEGADGKGTGDFTFNISNALLADKYENNAEISITFDGTVYDVKSDTETEDKFTPNNEKTVVIDTTKLEPAKATSAAWHKEDGKFVYKTAKTADSWNPDNTDNSASKTAKLKYTASKGDDALITLSGLKSGVNGETLNKDFTPAYADKDGKALIPVEEEPKYNETTGKLDYIVNWYPQNEKGEPDKNKDAVVTETTPEGGETKITGIDKVVAYVVNLNENVIDKDAMVKSPVTLKILSKDDVTDEKTYKDKGVFVTFDGEAAREGEPDEEEATLTPVTKDGKVVEGSYKYVAAHMPAYFSKADVEGTETINYVHASGQYGFIINGLPAKTDTEDIDKYFTFAKAVDEEGNEIQDEFTVTLTKDAFGTESFATYSTTNPDGVISLTDIDLNGTEKEETTGDAKSIKLALPEEDATSDFYTKEHVSEEAGLANKKQIEGTSAYTYDYNAASYYGYFELADKTTATTVKYTAAVKGKTLFKISGLPDKDETRMFDAHNTEGVLTDVGAISVDNTDKKVVTLRNTAFVKGQNITITDGDYTLALFAQADCDALTDADDKAKLQGFVVATNLPHVPGKFEADESGDGYTFTAGYKPEQYTLDTTKKTASLAQQEGYADKIAITGLEEGLGGEGYTFTDNEKGEYVLKDKDGKAVLEIVHTAVEDDPETDVNEANEGYTVKLYDGALAANPDDKTSITLKVNPATGHEGDIKAAFDINNLSDVPKDTYGSFKVTPAEDEEGINPNKYTFTSTGKTAGYVIDEKGNVVYADKEETTFTIEGIAEGLALEGTKDNDVIKQLEAKDIIIAADKGEDGKETGDINVTLMSKKVLADNQNIQLDSESNYRLLLAGNILTSLEKATEPAEFTEVKNGTATYKIEKINSWYADNGQNAFTFHPESGGATFEIKGLADVKADELNVAENKPIDIEEVGEGQEEGTISVKVTFNDTSIFGKGTIELGTQPTGYEIRMEVSSKVTGNVKVHDEDDKDEADKADVWDVKEIADGKATYSAGGHDAYYLMTYGKDEAGEDDKTDLKSLTYQAEVPNTEIAFSGLNTTLTKEDLESAIEFADAEEEGGKATVKISEAIHGENGATIASNDNGYNVIVDAATNITGTDKDDIFTVNKAATVNGGAGNDTFDVDNEGAIVDGGAGNDTFNVTAGTVVFGEGNDSVEYSQGVTIKTNGDFTYEFADNVEKDKDTKKVIGGDVILKDGKNNTLTLKDAGSNVVWFVDAKGNSSNINFDQDINDVFSIKGGGLTVDASYEGDAVGPEQFGAMSGADAVVTIDASKVEQALEITGNKKPNNVIIGTNSDDTINPQGTTNTVTGNDGADVFVYNSGKLTITDFNKRGEDEADSIKLAKEDASVKDVEIKNNNLNLIVGDGSSIELQNVFSTDVTQVAVAITDANDGESEFTYTKSGTIVDGENVTLTSGFSDSKGYKADADVKNITALNTRGTTIDASETNGVSINASAAANTIIGGKGSDTLTGAATKADLFVYKGGADTVTNFEAADKVSLSGYDDMSYDMSKISAISVTADEKDTEDTDESAIKFTFDGTNSLELKGAKDTVTVNGTAYTFDDNMYFDARKMGVTLTSSATDGFDATSKEAYSSIVSIDASAVTTPANITGNGNHNVIKAGKFGGTLTGGKGNDLFVYNGGNAVIEDYNLAENKDKDSISVGGGTITTYGFTGEGNKDVVLSYGEGSSLTIVGGADKEIQLAENGKKAESKMYSALGNFDDKKTALTLASGTTSFNAGTVAEAYPKLVSIVASEVGQGASVTAANKNSYLSNAGNNKASVTLTGNAGKDTLIAGEKGDMLNGGAGNDLISLSSAENNGADTVVVGAGGTDTIRGFDKDKDVLTYATAMGGLVGTETETVTATFKDAAIATKSGKSTLTLTLTDFNANDSKVVVEDIGKGKTVDSATVKFSDGDYEIGTDRITKGTEVILTSAFKGTIQKSDTGRETTLKSYSADNTITAVYASATKGGFSLGGGQAGITLEGGAGADTIGVEVTGDNEFTGNAGNDVFIYSGGNDTITDFGNGSDKILLDDGYTMREISRVDVTPDDPDKKIKSGRVDLTFTKGSTVETLSVFATDLTKVTIADSDNTKGAAYDLFTGGQIAIGKDVTILGGGEEIIDLSDPNSDYKDLKSVAVQGEATVKGKTAASNNIKLLSGGSATGGTGKDTLAALGGNATLTGKEADDLFIYNGGNAVITDYSEKNGARAAGDKLGKDKVSIGADVGAITGIANASGKNGGFMLTFGGEDENNTLTLEGITKATKVDLTTTTVDAKGKSKATKTNAYFSDGAILDNSDKAKAKSAIVAGNSDFSSIDGTAGQKGAKDLYAALVTITSANTASIAGNSKNNVITLSNGGTVKGGIGNDTYIIGGAATVGDFGIGATKIVKGNELVTLAKKVSDSIYSGDGTYAEGKDKVQVHGTITSVSVSGITKADKTNKTTKTDGNSFSVTLNVEAADSDENFQVVLENIQRQGKKNTDNATKDTTPYVNDKSDYTDLNSLQIFELNNKGKYTKVKWDNLVTLTAASSDAPDFGSADLDEIMDVTPAVTTGDSGKTKDADSFIITGSGDDSSDLTSKKN